MKNKIYFAKVDKTKETKIPTKREGDAGYDVYANFEGDYLAIEPHETVMIPTNLASAFSSDYVAILKERGSTGTKGIGQRCGVIDSGFRGEWFVPITNHNDKHLFIMKPHIEFVELSEEQYSTTPCGIYNDKFYDKKDNVIIYPYEKAICQVVMVEVPKLQTEEISYEELLKFESERGTGKLGSSEK